MMEFIGQPKLQKVLEEATLVSLPKTVLLLGDSGCGKHTFVQLLAQKLNVDTITISEKITPDQLNDYYNDPSNKFYLIELGNFTEKQQNQFLKFVEEPTASMNIFIVAENECGILPTILSRCTKYRFEKYSVETLKTLNFCKVFQEDLIFKICKTPGQLQNLKEVQFLDTYKLCKAIISNFKNNSYANSLTAALKLNFKEDYDKIDVDLFLRTLSFVSFEEYIHSNTEESFIVYSVVQRYLKKKVNRPVVVEYFILNLLTEIWKEINDDKCRI